VGVKRRVTRVPVAASVLIAHIRRFDRELGTTVA
jgi:hypothetical protein